MRRLDIGVLLAVIVIGACSYLAQTSTSDALSTPGFAVRQLVWLIVGLVLMLVFSFADYRVLARLSPLFYTASVAVLAFMLVAAPVRAGQRAWLSVGSFTVQPSEFARVAVILAVAALAAEHRKNWLTGRLVLKLGALVAVPALLVALEPDLGVALTYAPIMLAALALGGIPWRAWAVLAISGALLAGAGWAWYLKPYQKERILTFANPDRAPYGAGYQQRQSRIAIGSGELTGKGLRGGTQSQLRFLPAQHTDFIFAVWAEETGFVGAGILVAAYAMLIMRIFLIAITARDRLGAMLAGCVGLVMLSQVLVNVAMATGLAPTTGITLPLMSYGGSSVLATAVALGLVQSIWRLRYANM